MLTKADKTRQHIIRKSVHLFNTKGYHATSMKDILLATGLAKGGIYGNFSSKDEIALEAFDYAYLVVSQELRLRIKRQNNAVDKLKAVIDYYKDYSINSPIVGGCPILNMGLDAGDVFPPLQKKAAAAVEQMLESITYIVQQGINRQQIKPDIVAAEMADHIFFQIEGALALSKILGSPAKLNRLLNNLKKFIDEHVSI